MKLDFIDLGKLSVSKANMRYAKKAPDVSDILPTVRARGVLVPPRDYPRRTREVCANHDVLYISDEVVTAFGRLGHIFASKDVFDIQPDIITSAKGISSGYQPLSATIVPN